MTIMILCQTECSVLDTLGQNSEAVTFVVATKKEFYLYQNVLIAFNIKTNRVGCGYFTYN